ncbi:MAG TPA: hypothetical protein VMR41_03075 [Patescibacteria group bacterium]|nr:hypothetical protein [Patescibacteria group bacterium]
MYMSLPARRFPNLLRTKLFLLFALCSLLFALCSAPAFAQTPQPSTSSANQTTNQFTTPNADNTVPRNQHSWVQTVMLDVMSAMTCQLAGVDPVNPKGCLGVNATTHQYSLAPQNMGLLGMVVSGIGVTYTPAAHLGDYTGYLAGNFGVTKTALAAGYCDSTNNPDKSKTGYCKLTPLLGMWTTFRNIAYLAFVLIFIVIGFAIMLRVKINAQTVMSIQYAIPRIIIGLLLITFSYAIAGFLIDLMYVIMAVIINLAASIDPTTNNPTPISSIVYGHIQGNNPLGFFNSLTSNSAANSSTLGDSWQIAQSFGNAFGNLVTTTGTIGQVVVGLVAALLTSTTLGSVTGSINVFGIPVGGILNLIATGTVAGIAASRTGDVSAYIGTVLGFLVIIISILVSLVRVWVVLLKAYIFILLDVIFAPFWIIASIIPKSKLTFSTWLRDLAANLAVFPAVIGFFLLAKLFVDFFNNAPKVPGTSDTNIFVPPLLGNLDLSASALAPLIGLGFILLAPSALKFTRSLFQAPEMNMLGNIGQSLGIGTKMATSLWGVTGGKLFGKDKNGNPRLLSGLLAQRKKEGAEKRFDTLQRYRDMPNKNWLQNTALGIEGWRQGLRKFARTNAPQFESLTNDAYGQVLRRGGDVGTTAGNDEFMRQFENLVRGRYNRDAYESEKAEAARKLVRWTAGDTGKAERERLRQQYLGQKPTQTGGPQGTPPKP